MKNISVQRLKSNSPQTGFNAACLAQLFALKSAKLAPSQHNFGHGVGSKLFLFCFFKATMNREQQLNRAQQF
jgi:hypothetical protein